MINSIQKAFTETAYPWWKHFRQNIVESKSFNNPFAEALKRK